MRLDPLIGVPLIGCNSLEAKEDGFENSFIVLSFVFQLGKCSKQVIDLLIPTLQKCNLLSQL
jgi:hypothetical protein